MRNTSGPSGKRSPPHPTEMIPGAPTRRWSLRPPPPLQTRSQTQTCGAHSRIRPAVATDDHSSAGQHAANNRALSGLEMGLRHCLAVCPCPTPCNQCQHKPTNLQNCSGNDFDESLSCKRSYTLVLVAVHNFDLATLRPEPSVRH